MTLFNTILYPVSLTEMSPKVAPYVVEVAKRFDAEVHLLHVLRRFDWFVNTYISDPPKPDFKRIASDFENEILAQAQNKLDAFRAKYFTGVRMGKAKVVSGTTYQEIIQYAEDEKIDLIIMGTGTSLQHIVFGSVAEKVSRMAGVPVMLISGASRK